MRHSSFHFPFNFAKRYNEHVYFAKSDRQRDRQTVASVDGALGTGARPSLDTASSWIRLEVT